MNLAVVGTDTGVGKTAVACGIVRAWRARGIDAVGMKPFATGCRSEGGVPRSDDADALVAASGEPQVAYDDACPCRWAPPVAPLAAGATATDVARAEAAFRRLAAARGAVIVEGIGGVLTPIAPGLDVADVVAAWGLPALVVGRLGLGTLNHTRLSVEALARRGVAVAGIVLVETVPSAGDPSAASNAAILADLTGLPIVGVVPHGEAGRAERHVRLEPRRPAHAAAR